MKALQLFVVVPRILTVIFGVCLCAISPTALSDGQSVPTGTYEGTGRACTGRLDIRKQTISWKAAFTNCNAISYTVTSGAPEGGTVSTAFHLGKTTKKCPFSELELFERKTTSGDTSYEVVGYPTISDLKAKRLDNALACPLIKIR